MPELKARNEALIKASLEDIWAVITDIDQLHKINPGVIKATGRMDKEGETRTCEIDNRGRKGILTERLIELVPHQRTVWTIENDTMGFGKMLKDTRFVFDLEKLSAHQTRVVSETWYQPPNVLAKIMSGLMIKKAITKAQAQILENIKTLTEKNNG